jgi:hypothetical protein
MKFEPKNPPRVFSVGSQVKVPLADCGTLSLAPDEQVTLITERGGEYDVARKNWGFYATPSLNGRLQQFKLHGVLIRNRNTGRYFIVLVEEGKDEEFGAYLNVESLEVISWLDTSERLDALKQAVIAAGGAK